MSLKIGLVIALLAVAYFPQQAFTFSCFTCNNRLGEDDTKPCVDRREDCDNGITACSTVSFRDFQRRFHVRKFCTPPGTPLSQYLSTMTGSAVCQNIQSQSFSSPNQRIPVVRVGEDVSNGPSPPAFVPRAPSSGEAPSSVPQPPGIIPDSTFSASFRAADDVAENHPPSSVPLPPAPQDVFMSTLLCVCTKDSCNGGSWEDVLTRTMLQNVKGVPPKFEKVDEKLRKIDKLLQLSGSSFDFDV